MNSSTPPEDAFAALGSEIRIEILHTVAEAADAGSERLSFSEIHDRIDVASTSRLSYHLSELDDVFVRKNRDGYRLTQAGDRVVRAIRSGTYSEVPSFDPITVEGVCPACDGTVLDASYRDPFLTVDCRECDTTLVTYNLPPAESRERGSREILESCNQRVHNEYEMALEGTCPMCSGSTETEIQKPDRLADFSCVATCRQCNLRLYAPLEVRLLYHPAVVSLYWEYGVDATNVPLWDLPTYVDDWAIERLDDDQSQYRATVSFRDSSLGVTLTDDLTVEVSDGESSV